MIKIKNKQAIEKMRVAGEKLALVMQEIAPHVVAGCSTLEIDKIFEEKMRTRGLKAECKGYAGYPAVTCISLNDTVVHGIPSQEIILKTGDFVKIDVVGSHRGYCADMTRSFFVGSSTSLTQKLANVAQRALDCAIKNACPGNRLFDISYAVQREVEKGGFAVVKEYAGHGIGRDLHEAPEVPNFGEKGTGLVLRSGMTLAIEPMLTESACDVLVGADGWAAKTSNGCLAGHVEDTVLILDSGPEVLTRLQ
ncbi:type I methionyl aminopeptidase [Candidatus Babeliales bacterium]|nr:type I methionyl aminopeptidase [Candidatus Babeliales bacterium]